MLRVLFERDLAAASARVPLDHLCLTASVYTVGRPTLRVWDIHACSTCGQRGAPCPLTASTAVRPVAPTPSSSDWPALWDAGTVPVESKRDTPLACACTASHAPHLRLFLSFIEVRTKSWDSRSLTYWLFVPWCRPCDAELLAPVRDRDRDADETEGPLPRVGFVRKADASGGLPRSTPAAASVIPVLF